MEAVNCLQIDLTHQKYSKIIFIQFSEMKKIKLSKIIFQQIFFLQFKEANENIQQMFTNAIKCN